MKKIGKYFISERIGLMHQYSDKIDKIFSVMKKICVFLMIVFLPISNLPKKYTLPGFGNNLAIYFLIILFSLFVIEIIINKEKISKKFIIYLTVLILWVLLTSINGMVQYPYYREIDISLSRGFTLIEGFFTFDSNKEIYKRVFMLIKSIIDGMRVFVFPWIGSYVIYHIFRKQDRQAFIFIRKCFLCLAICLALYAIPEILLFKFDFSYMYNILEKTNSYLYDVKSYLNWYPPVVWQNQQLRSYCVEPSMIGVFSGTIIPFIWSIIIDNKSRILLCSYVYYFMLPIMSKARTATAIIMLLLIQMIMFIKSIRKPRKFIIILLVLSMFSVLLGMIRPLDFAAHKESNIKIQASEYVSENVKTITNPEARSNGSRLINIKSHLAVIFKHPLLGTGYSFKDLYVRDDLIEGALNNGEIKGITEGINNQGIFRYSYGNVNEYIFIITNAGIIGLLLWLVPPAYIYYIFFKKKAYKDKYMVTLIIIINCSLAAMIAGCAFLNYYIIIGLSYIMIQNLENTLLKEPFDNHNKSEV